MSTCYEQPCFVLNMVLLTACTQALLRAIGEKLIPGLSFATKIALLQQTSADDRPSIADSSPADPQDDVFARSALQYILENDAIRNEVQAELDGE